MGFSDQLSGGYADMTSSTYEEFTGNGSTLAFKLTNKAKDITQVKSWVAGVTNDWAVKTETTHWSHNAPTNDFMTVTYEAGNAPLAAQADVTKIICPSKSGAAAADFFVVYAQDGTSYACWLKKVAADVAQIATLTLVQKSSQGASDFIVSKTTDGSTYAVWLDTTGSGTAPTSSVYTAIAAGNKAKADISGATTADNVRDIVKTTFEGISGYTAKCVITTGSGTCIFTQQVAGDCSDPAEYSAASTTPGSGANGWVVGTAGDAIDLAPTSVSYTGVATARKTVADISSDTTGANVAARVRAALAAITGIGTKITVSTVTSDYFTCTNAVAGDGTVALNLISTGASAGSFTITNPTVGKTYTCRVTYSQSASQMQNGCTDGM
jgi:hypothetical protein